MRHAVSRTLSVLCFFVSISAGATTYTVNNLGDAGDATPGDDVCATGGAVCTLRAALEEANAHAGSDAIAFSVAGTITPGSNLPASTGTVLIDATTAAGVILDGAGSVATGLSFLVTATGSEVRGFKIIGFSAAGISSSAPNVSINRNMIGPADGFGTGNGTGVLVDAGGTGNTIGGNVNGDGNFISGNGTGINLAGANGVIRDNVIGVDAGGMAAIPNTTDGVVVSGSGTAVGGGAGLENLISGNNGAAVRITGSGITVAGNFIGTMPGGTSTLPNGSGITASGNDNFIGTATLRNIIGNHQTFGISLSGTGNTVVNNYVGVEPDGLTAIANGIGIDVLSSAVNSVIGTTTSGNVISGNANRGINVQASGTTIRNNVIGLSADGTTLVSNGAAGISAGGTSVTIGGSAAGEGNVISGNDIGIEMQASSSTIAGNIIGLNAAGDDIRGNSSYGIELFGGATGVTIGGATAGARNVISGNSELGVYLHTASGNSIAGNYIGTDSTGATSLGNAFAGIALGFDATGNNISANVVSGNSGEGIAIEDNASANNVYGNTIGRNAANTAAVPNFFNGVLVSLLAANNVIGSVALGGNTIAGNNEAGIAVREADGLSPDNNTFAANSIFSNGDLGVDIGESGPQPNDPLDADLGPNDLQNYPVIDVAVTSASNTFVQGSINTVPSSSVALHFYSSPTPDPSNFGEGQTYLGTTTVNTDVSGNATFSFSGLPSTAGDVVTATATIGSTSEFSQFETVVTAPTVQFSAADYPTPETGTVTITVTRTGDLTATSTVAYTTSNGTAVLPDYATASGTLTFAPTEASKTFNVTINPDTIDEPNETINLTLSSPTAASLGAQSTATITIADDDPPPAISITDLTQAEGTGGSTNFVFTVSLLNGSSSTVTVEYSTAPGTATAGTDYTSIGTTTLTFLPGGPLSQQVTVVVAADTAFETNETFFVNLANATNATIDKGQGNGTITNDDLQPTILINDVTQNELNAGTSTFTFTVSLSNASFQTITVDYATADDTATAGSDYVAASGQLTFTPGVTSQPIVVTVNGDTAFEGNEAFFVNLTIPTNATISDTQGIGTLTDDDGTPQISIDDLALPEGTGGTTPFTFTVTLSNASASTVTVNYATAPGSATAGTDYTTASGVVTFAPNVTSQPVTINVAADPLAEPAETFFVNLSLPSNATILDGQGQATIQNDDVNANLGITKSAVVTTTHVHYTITVNNAGPDPATGTTVTDVLPAGTTFTSVNTTQGSCSGTTTVTCSLGTLNNGASATITLVVSPTIQTGTVIIPNNTATVTSAVFDQDLTNNSSTSAEPIPAMSEWALLALAMLIAAVAIRRMS